MDCLGFTTRVGKAITTFWWDLLTEWNFYIFSPSAAHIYVVTEQKITVVSGHGHAWTQSLGCLELSWTGVRSVHYLIFYSFYLVLSSFWLTDSWNSMSANMVACIAVEAISILEKLHLKGYLLLMRSLLLPLITFSWPALMLIDVSFFAFFIIIIIILGLCMEMWSRRTFYLVNLELLMRRSCFLSILVWVCLQLSSLYPILFCCADKY